MPYLKNMSAAQVRHWLIAHGHKPARVVGLKLVTVKERAAALRTLHESKVEGNNGGQG